MLVAAIADAEKVGSFWQNALSDTVTFTSAVAEDARPDRQRLPGKPII